uniref:Uncharacterized protein n=1 Tax=Arundo donax TaxID=35708 RepID=A0A0A9A6N1_ARUDO
MRRNFLLIMPVSHFLHLKTSKLHKYNFVIK